jgi:chemotaxis protein methyltransferase CheR
VIGLTDVFKPVAERRGVYQPIGVLAAPVRTLAFGATAPRVTAMAGI